MTQHASEGSATPWWLCPNEPKCPHAAVFHDIEEQDDPLPRCCFDGCDCGRKDSAGLSVSHATYRASLQLPPLG